MCFMFRSIHVAGQKHDLGTRAQKAGSLREAQSKMGMGISWFSSWVSIINLQDKLLAGDLKADSPD